MKIGTINIDWFKKSKSLQGLIIAELDKQDFDFLIITENIMSFHFNEKYFHYHTTPIPTNADIEFQNLYYGQYIKNEIPIRTSIFSKHKSESNINTIDPYTSLCHKFILDGNEIYIYATIIGTYGIQYQTEIAKPELDNFKADIRNISSNNPNLLIAGDFNTSFYKEEKRQLSIIQSREEIIKFTDQLNITRSTEELKETIDHIFISANLNKEVHIAKSTFLTNNILNDEPHHGVVLDLNFNT